MTSDELVGQVAASYLRDHVSDDDSTGVARYLLDCLSAEQTAAIAKTILTDARLSPLIDIKLPEHFVGHLGLPLDVLTNERTTYFRNAACEKPALLLANTGDDEDQSLKDLVPISWQTLRLHTELWVRLAAAGLPINDQHQHWWAKALQALLEVRDFPLDRFAHYVLDTRRALEDGQPMLLALGVALPALHIPRDTAFFSSLNEKTARQLAKWKALYEQAIKKRACYLVKQTPTQNLLLEDDLQNAFAVVQDEIPIEYHPTIKAFIHTNSGWSKEAAALAQCEWDEIKRLFDGLKREKLNLGKATCEFYDEGEESLLTVDERDYLDRLSESKRKEAQDEDEDFYRNHRQELKKQPSLKTKWERFIFGTPVETNDFLLGLVLCLEWLFDKDMPSSKRKLRISSDHRTKRDLRELNVDAGLYFSLRYGGLKELLGNRVSWDIGELINFATLDEQWRAASKPHVNHSVAKAALQLKFTLELEVESSTGTLETTSKQLIWTYEPNAIGCEFPGDWLRLSAHPFSRSHANREIVSGKGRFQSLDLRNVRTLYPAYGQDRGSLVATYKKDDDIALVWPANLRKVQEQGMISAETGTKLLSLFQTFQKNYTDAIAGFMDSGLAHDRILSQAQDYGALLHAICSEAKGDRNRESLLQPLLQIGAIPVDGGRVSTIVAPWHPLRFAAMATKARQVASLVRHLLTAEEIYFGDAPFFFQEREQELSHPYYPEIVLGWNATKPELLSLSDQYLDYSLHETPLINNDGFDDTNENPSETASLIVDLAKRFLSLYPHERANLSVVLYNCDSARLPYAVVDKMSELHEDEEDMRCQIVLRHRDGEKLRGLYEKIIESSETDADSFVSSEVAKDFMARLRIGIMADQAPIRDPKDGPTADLVFLQDVIARHAGVEWYAENSDPVAADSFIPAQWSRRRPAAIDDMKSVVYLCCPVQTTEGWAFITALTTFLKGDWDGVVNKRLLPARKLDFNDPVTANIFKEVHDLGNWIVNYDELLDRRQLLNQNVKVIRYKQGVSQGRNLLISSTAPLSFLRSMLLGRIRDLNLGLTEQECRELTEKFVDDANEISGDIVLRAAKRGRSASELIGIVLSRYMMRYELGIHQRVLVKVTVVKNRGVGNRGRRGKAGSWFKHGAYLQRDGAQGRGRGVGFDTEGHDIHLSTTLARWQREGDRHMIKLIVSPEHGEHLDLSQFARELMTEIAQDLHTQLEWVAIDHYNTQHPHLHIVIRGKDSDGKPLYINRDYLRHGVHERGRELATRSVGMRLQPEITQSRERAVHREVWTELDQQLRQRMDEDRHIPVTEDEPLSPHELRRLEALRQRGLAWNDNSPTWQLARAWQRMSEQGDAQLQQHDRERTPEHERVPEQQPKQEQDRERERREDEQERQRRLTQIIDLEQDLGWDR